MIGLKFTFKRVKKERFLRAIINELRELSGQIFNNRTFNKPLITIELNAFDGDNSALNCMQNEPQCFYNTSACRNCPVHYREIQTIDQFQIYETRKQMNREHVFNGLINKFMFYAPDVYHDVIELVLQI